MEEVFGSENACALIPFLKTTSATAARLSTVSDVLLWYARDIDRVTYSQIFVRRSQKTLNEQYTSLALPDGTTRRMTAAEIRGDAPAPEGRRFMPGDMSAQSGGENSRFEYACAFR